jgi:MFS family permease
VDQQDGTNEELPFTPTIADYVQSEVAINRRIVADRPLRFVLIVFGLASVVPAIFTAVLPPQRESNRGTVIAVWLICWAIGALIAYGTLTAAAHEKRDLVGGVFLRWSGPFTVRILSGRSGAGVQFHVAGRNLQLENARPLYSIQSGNGAVDYLPASGTLMEVRDQSGQVLWSRFQGRG